MAVIIIFGRIDPRDDSPMTMTFGNATDVSRKLIPEFGLIEVLEGNKVRAVFKLDEIIGWDLKPTEEPPDDRPAPKPVAVV